MGIHDGDTLSILRSGIAVKVRLDEIDAPEFGQDLGRQAKKSLSALCYGKWADVRGQGQDKYGRLLGRVFCAGIDANAEQVRRGYAWFYVHYGRDPELRNLEASARLRGVGLWSSRRPVPPWDFRHESGDTQHPASPYRNRLCGAKRTCREMASCEEATYYLRRCGLSGLDRNRDGVPCESLCR